jgi:RNA polymerase sigma factor (sigma-70 family)
MRPPTDRDAALVDRLRAGDRGAFRELYARFSPSTFGFLRRLAGRREAAEDLHQEVWLSIARHATRLAADTDLAAWIFTVARNRFRSSRRGLEATSLLADAAAQEQLAVAPPGDDPGCRDLERALASLPEPHREVLLLVAIEGLDMARAAAVLAIRPDAARQRLARARAALAAAVAAQAHPTSLGKRMSS